MNNKSGSEPCCSGYPNCVHAPDASDKDKRIKEAESLLRAAHRWLPDNLMTLSGEPNTKQQIGLFLGMDLL